MTERAPAPAGDVTFLEKVVGLTEHLYASHGAVHPFGVIERGDDNGGRELILIFSEGLNTAEAKIEFMTAMRFQSIEKAALRSCLVFECWTVLAKTEEAKRLAAEITGRKGSLREHPDCTDGVAIQVESDDGFLGETLAIERPHPKLAKLIHHQPPVFIPRSQGGSAGLMSGHHVPTSVRRDPMVQAFRVAMAQQERIQIITADELFAGKVPPPPKPH